MKINAPEKPKTLQEIWGDKYKVEESDASRFKTSLDHTKMKQALDNYKTHNPAVFNDEWKLTIKNKTLKFKINDHKGKIVEGEAWRIQINGEGIEEIPTKIPRKKAKARKQIKDVNNITID